MSYFLKTGYCLLFLLTYNTAIFAQNISDSVNLLSNDFGKEISSIKDLVLNLKIKSEQTEKSQYNKNYQLIIRGVDMIQELHNGSLQILTARNQNIFTKKVADINNPSSDALGFQLLDVIIKSVEENIANLTTIEKPEKARLTSTVGTLVDGLKSVVSFPPLQIISNALSVISSFTIFKAKSGLKKSDDMIIEGSNPINKETLQKITKSLMPYIDFYNELNELNRRFENTLYQHTIQYKDFIEALAILKQDIEKSVDFKNSLGEQINAMFEYNKSALADFNFKAKNESAEVKSLTINIYTMLELVDTYKKFTNDFIQIQSDYFTGNISILEKKAKILPVKDDIKIDKMLNELNQLKNGNPGEGIIGFDVAYKERLSIILTKLNKVNQIRY